VTSSSRGPRASGQVCGSWVGVASCPTSSTFSPSFHRRRASSARGGHGVARGVRRAPWPGAGGAGSRLSTPPPTRDGVYSVLRTAYLRTGGPGPKREKPKRERRGRVWSVVSPQQAEKKKGVFKPEMCEKSCRSGIRLYSKIPEVTPFYFTPAAHTLTASQPHTSQELLTESRGGRPDAWGATDLHLDYARLRTRRNLQSGCRNRVGEGCEEGAHG
jgi:hypothetical protein